MARATPDVEQLVSEYEAALNGDESKLDVVAETYTYNGPGAPEAGVRGRDAYAASLRDLRGAFPDVEYTLEDVIVDDDVAVTEWTVSGTHEGAFREFPPTGRTFEIRSMAKQSIDGGQIQSEYGYYDLQDVLEQLGATE